MATRRRFYTVKLYYKSEMDATWQGPFLFRGADTDIQVDMEEYMARIGIKAKRLKIKIEATCPGLLIDHIGIVFQPKRVK